MMDPLQDDDLLCSNVCRQVIRAVRTPVLLANPEGNVLYANQSAVEMASVTWPQPGPVRVSDFLGINPSEMDQLLPASWWDVNPAEAADESSEVLLSLHGRPVSRVLRRHMDAADGKPIAMLLFEWATAWEQRYLDSVKARDGLAYALEAAQERFNVLFRESSDPVLILNPEGDILSANAGFEHYTGLGAELWFRDEKGWGDCVHADDLLLLRRSIDLCAKEGVSELIELRLLSADRFYQWFELSLSPLHDETRKVRGIVGVARNINRRKELESQLRERANSAQKSHQRAQLLIAKLKHFFGRVGTFPADIDSYLKRVCETLNDMYRPTAIAIQVIGKDAQLVVQGKDGERAEAVVVPEALTKMLMKSGLPLCCNTLQQTDPYRSDPDVIRQGFRTCLGAPLRDSTGKVRGAVCLLDIDKQYYDHVDVELITVASLHIAARLRGEEQEVINQELADHLRQAQKMEAVGLLAGGVAHDFNNILSGILGFSSYLLSKVDPQSTMHRDLKLIEQSAMRAADLTRQLLAFARRKHFAKEAICLNGVIRDVLSLVRRSAARDMQIIEQLEDNLPAVHGDAGQLNQVVMNLCLNASEAMRDAADAQLTVRTELRPLTPRERIVLDEDTDDEFVCLSVADNGIGMTAELQEHIYEPFYTTRSDKGGTGLGLSIVYGIISNHGGHVIVDSEVGEGTTFMIYLPAFSGTPEDQQTPDIDSLTGTERILVIDDELIVRQMVTEVLRGQGYEVISADAGRKGVEYLDELRDRIDLVLLDIVMPEMDGEATMKALQAVRPDVPILLTSGFVQEQKRDRMLNRGALGLVYKPCKSQDLLRQVRQALNRAAANRTEVAEEES